MALVGKERKEITELDSMSLEDLRNYLTQEVTDPGISYDIALGIVKSKCTGLYDKILELLSVEREDIDAMSDIVSYVFEEVLGKPDPQEYSYFISAYFDNTDKCLFTELLMSNPQWLEHLVKAVDDQCALEDMVEWIKENTELTVVNAWDGLI